MWLAVVALLAIHAGMLAWAATKHSPTIDEPGHLVAGISHWQFGRFELYRVNPPLVRMVAALPVLAVGCETDWGQFCDTPGRRCEFAVGRDFVTANGQRSIRLFTLARWACIPFSLAGGLFCFLWAGELWGHYGAGLISLILWCFDPNILAHGELITTDCAAASLGLGAGYLFWRWLKCPTWGRAAAAGLVLGLAQLAKLSWLILFGLWPLLWLVWLCCQPQRAGKSCQHESRVAWPKQSAQLALILVMAVYLVNVAYGFQGSGTRLGKFTFLSHLMSGQPTGTPGNRFAGSWLGRLPTPLPEQYVLGIDAQRTDFEDYPVRSYLRGEWKEGGWWYYYLYALAVKMPHGTQLLLGMLVLFLAWPLWRRRHGVREDDADGVGGERVEGEGLCRDGSRPACGVSAADPVPFRHLIILLAPGIVLLALVSSQTEINLHFRYALPCFGFAFVLAGAAWLVLRSRRWLAVTAVSACLCWTVYAAVANHPHNLAYFNELAGGPANGHRHLLHSSLDWGQDMLALKAYLDDERFGAAAPGAHLYAMFEPADMGLRYVSLPEWVERRASESECSTADPRLVVSATYYHLAAADSSMTTASWADASSSPPGGVARVGPARLRVSGFSAFLGQVQPYDHVTTTFVVRNASRSPVRVLRIDTRCGCTTVDATPRRWIGPGQDFEMTVSIETQANRSIAEPVLLTVTTDEDSAERRTLQFDVFAWQPPSMEVSPTVVEFGRIEPGEVGQFVLHVSETPYDEFEIESVSTSGLPIEARVECQGRPGHREYLARLTLKPDGLAARHYERSIFLETTSRCRPRVEVPVRFSVPSSVRVRPSFMSFGLVPLEGESRHQVVDIEHVSGRALQLTLLDRPDGFRVEAQNEGKGPFWVSLDTDSPGTKSGVVRLRAQWDGGEEIVSVVCHGLVKESKL